MKSKTAAGLLALCCGGIGVHKFYLGENGAGILYLLFSWTFIPTIIAFFEGLGFLCGMSDEAFNNKYNEWKTVYGKDYYDELLKFESLREKQLISEEDYYVKLKEIKEKIKKYEESKKK